MREVSALRELRAVIAGIEGRSGGSAAARRRAILPFGETAIDGHLPGGAEGNPERGLRIGGLHEACGAGRDAGAAAAPALFVASIVGRLGGDVLWCARSIDVFPAALAAVGLEPGRVVWAACGSRHDVLSAMEEGLRSSAICAAVAEVFDLKFLESRRLGLAAEASGVMAWVVRHGEDAPEGRAGAAPARAPASAALTRWRVGASPSPPSSSLLTLRPLWLLELLRCRNGLPGQWIVEAPDEHGLLSAARDPVAWMPARPPAGGLGLSPHAGDGQAAPARRRAG
ncbi:protein ImuA [Pseudochelatococcus lubricantis]|uniref:Protein ImuA n=1 Tax=Pseudochelatococcus lubricantis TaxID=1538102 RepID=A0ABX0UZI1_9HYPH|nr:damage-inducible mutagenesis protein [Pseudochelatococcus lubricantis]NIJ56980.1 protein ImuA [Pseudochelatococcus lubricantis]